MTDLRTAKSKPKGRRSRSLLPSPPPDPGADREQVAAWLTVALGLGGDPVQRAERYGRHEDARMVVVLRSNQRVVFERQADAFDARRLVRVVVTATGAIVPPYAYADGLQVASAMVRLAETLADDDGRTEAAEWCVSFLDGARRNTITVDWIDTPAGRFAALTALVNWTPPSRPAALHAGCRACRAGPGPGDRHPAPPRQRVRRACARGSRVDLCPGRRCMAGWSRSDGSTAARSSSGSRRGSGASRPTSTQCRRAGRANEVVTLVSPLVPLSPRVT